MAAENKIRFIHRSNLNAPQVNNNRASLIAALDAALVTGINLPSITSAVIDGSTIVVTFSSIHNLSVFQVVRLSAFIPAELNADFRVIGVPSINQIAIELPQTVTGISTVGAAILAPLGYEKSFSGTNKAVYRNANPAAQHRPFLRVDNSLDSLYNSAYAGYAKVGILKTCTDIDDTGGAQIPYDTTSSKKNWNATGSGSSVVNGWAKWYYSRINSPLNTVSDNYNDTGNVGKSWTIIGDESAFYLLISPWASNQNNKLIYGFGVYQNLVELDNPYFLSCSLRYASADIDYDFTGSYKFATATPFVVNASNSKVLLFEDVVNKAQVLATTDTRTYDSGTSNIFLNTNMMQEVYFVTDTSWLIGTPPFIRYALNSRSENDNSSVAIDNRMYLCGTVALSLAAVGRIYFDLGAR